MNVFALVKEDKERQAEVDAELALAAKEQAARALGRAIMAGAQLGDAEKAGEAREREVLAGQPKAYLVDPDEMYPAVIAHIKAVLAGAEKPDSAGVALYHEKARLLAEKCPEAFDLALVHRDHFQAGDPDLDPRAQALEIARLWFTRLLKEQTKPLLLHITAGDKRFRL